MQLRLPVQARSVDRSQFPEPEFISVGPFEIIPEADPFPDFHAHFLPDADHPAAICSILSAYAVGPCLRARGAR